MSRLWLVLAAALVLLALGPGASASAAPPALTIASPAAGSSSEEPAPLFAGTTSDEADIVVVRIYEGAAASGTPVQIPRSTVPTGGAWSAQPSPLRNGTYTAVAEQIELGTLEPPGISESVTFTIAAPLPVVSLEPVAALSNDATPSFGGVAGTLAGDASSVRLAIYAGASASGSPVASGEASVGGGGAWSFTPASALADGTYTAIAEQSDAAGNVGESQPTTFAIDTAAPKPSLSAVVTPTKDSTPTFGGSTGKAAHDEQAVAVAVFTGASASGTPVAAGAATVNAGAWSYTAPALADGTYTVQASQRDEAGNEGHSSTATFTVDTTRPAVSLTPLATFLANSKPSFAGAAGIATGDIASVKLLIYSGTLASGSPVETVKATPSGASWTATPAKALSDGTTYTAIAEQSDAAGNVGDSQPTTFTIDTSAPKVTLNAVGAWTNDSTPTFGGSTGSAAHDEQAVAVAVFTGASASGTPVAAGAATVNAGAWSYTAPALADGTYTVQASQRDEAGNEGHSSTATFTVDTTSPAISLEPLASLGNDPTPSFAGVAGTAAGDVASVKLAIYDGTAASGSPLETLKASVGGGGSWAVAPGKALPDGTYTAIAEQSDEAGNAGQSESSTFTVKTKGPAVSLDPPAQWTSDRTPSFSGARGTSEVDVPAVTLEIYPGTKEKGSKPIVVVPASEGAPEWSVAAVPELADGTYTAVAVQFDKAHNEALSIAQTFTVDTLAPSPTLSAPGTSAGLETVSGIAGTAPGDRRQVTVELFVGASVEPGDALETITVNREAAGGAYSATFASLGAGEYTAVARQSDEAGNLGSSGPSTFTVTAPPEPSPEPQPERPTVTAASPSPPVASFTWVPSNPTIGQSVSFVSSSTDPSSAIGAYAWDLVGNGQFAPGGAVTTTSFATAGPHVVRLRVTDGNGLSSAVAQTIDVTATPPKLMQPFPIVRIAGSETSYGVNVRLLTVQAPVGAKIQVACAGRGCKTKAESRLATSSSKAKVPAGSVTLAFVRFERPLQSGVTLQIRVTKAGEIGKYTSFAIRRNKLPLRNDACLRPASSKPSACPSS